MLPYVFLYVFVSLGLYLSGRKGSRLAYYGSGLLLIAFAGARDGIGVDFDSYVELFDAYRMGLNVDNFQILNLVILGVASYFSTGENIVFATYSFITIACVFYFAKISKSKELTVFIFLTTGIYYLSTFNNVRQWAAIAMMLVALVALVEKKYLTAFVFCIIAAAFHKSAWITLVILGFRFRLSAKLYIAAACVGIMLTNAALSVLELSEYIDYTDIKRIDSEGSTLLLSGYIGFSMLSIYLLKYFDINEKLEAVEVMVVNMASASLLILISGAILDLGFVNIMRANAYFSVWPMIAIPLIFERMRQQVIYRYFFVPALLCFSGLYFWTIFFKGDAYLLTPYKSVLF